MAAAPSRMLRADARRNRDRILAAARDLLAERGPDVPVDAVARRAGVGTATLYRHFPGRDALLAEVADVELHTCVAMLDAAVADPDPWRGFSTVISEVCRPPHPAAPPVEAMAALRESAERDFAGLVRRAKAAGRLRPDFTRADLGLVQLAGSGLAAQPPAVANASARRLAGHFLRSFQADPA